MWFKPYNEFRSSTFNIGNQFLAFSLEKNYCTFLKKGLDTSNTF